MYKALALCTVVTVATASPYGLGSGFGAAGYGTYGLGNYGNQGYHAGAVGNAYDGAQGSVGRQNAVEQGAGRQRGYTNQAAGNYDHEASILAAQTRASAVAQQASAGYDHSAGYGAASGAQAAQGSQAAANNYGVGQAGVGNYGNYAQGAQGAQQAGYSQPNWGWGYAPYYGGVGWGNGGWGQGNWGNHGLGNLGWGYGQGWNSVGHGYGLGLGLGNGWTGLGNGYRGNWGLRRGFGNIGNTGWVFGNQNPWGWATGFYY